MHAARGDEVAFLGMAGLDDRGPIEDFVERFGVDGFPHALDEDGSLWARFGAVSRSAFVFVDDDGTVEVTSYGEYGDEERLDARIDELLAS